jgi:hypothetical protein
VVLDELFVASDHVVPASFLFGSMDEQQISLIKHACDRVYCLVLDQVWFKFVSSNWTQEIKWMSLGGK